MHYELGFFDSFIHAVVPGDLRAPVSSQNYELHIGRLEDESQQVRIRVINEVFSRSEATAVNLYIQAHQHLLVVLLDTAFIKLGTLPGSADNPSWTGLLTQCISCLDSLLYFLEQYFTVHCSGAEKLPELRRCLAARELKASLAAICKDLEGLQTDPCLVAAILRPLEDFAGPEASPYHTRNRLLWLKDLAGELQRFPGRTFRHEADLELMQLCCYLNFNSIPVRNCIIERCKQELGALPGKERPGKTAYFLKLLNQVPERAGAALCPERPSLRFMVSSWLLEERQHLAAPELWPEAGAEEPPVQKMQTSLSVGQLAYLASLLEKAGIVLPGTQAKLLEFFCSSFTCVRQQDVSTKSFKKHYYTPDISSVQAIRRFLLDMMRLSRQDFV